MLLMTLSLLLNFFKCNLNVNILHIHNSPHYYYFRWNLASAILYVLFIHLIIYHVVVFLSAISYTWHHTSTPLWLTLLFPKNNWLPLSCIANMWQNPKVRGQHSIIGVDFFDFFHVTLEIYWSQVIILGLTLIRVFSSIIYLIPVSISTLSGTKSVSSAFLELLIAVDVNFSITWIIPYVKTR